MSSKGLRVSVIVRPYDAIRAIGRAEMANKIEQIVYSCTDSMELIRDLHVLVLSARNGGP